MEANQLNMIYKNKFIKLRIAHMILWMCSPCSLAVHILCQNIWTVVYFCDRESTHAGISQILPFFQTFITLNPIIFLFHKK